MAHLVHAATNIENSGGWVIFLLRGTDLDGLHPSFRFGPSLVDRVCRAHNGHRRLGRFLVDDGAFLGLDVLHNIELIGCEGRNGERRNQRCCSN